MKPSWADAPEWAKYLAMDESGSWWWYDVKPKIVEGIPDWQLADEARHCAPALGQDWRDTLEPRPLDTSKNTV